ncbi:GspH/FimT family pseudopilin [Eleftheria terrae]|uniref:GspH/FimT family pseudopilin n=1 Tax=Eleftheria terrae TaxID=1597781 RepID=UPI00263BDC09|nr:GspH/FimT family pseudopilin [Eleftheria terrae]WKB52417.1 GspH/FimT family pseudopilin [Eleftheria terrae]
MQKNRPPLVPRRLFAGPARSAGFTLIELMVTVTVVAIVMALAAPSMQAFLTSRAIASHVDAFGSAVRLTRSEALKRSGTASMCMSVTTEEAAPTCAADEDGGWHSGWLVFADPDGDGAYTAESEELIAVQQPLTSSGGVTWNANSTSITFRANGLATASVMATITFDPKMPSDASERDRFVRTRCLTAQGRLGKCIVQTGDPDGSAGSGEGT